MELRKTKREVVLGRELFSFSTYSTWQENAENWFSYSGVPLVETICLDMLGRVCATAADFHRALIDGTYPIIVYTTNLSGIFERIAPDVQDILRQSSPPYRLDRDNVRNIWQIVGKDKSYPAGTDLTRAVNLVGRLNASHKANIEVRNDKLCVCWNLHEKHEYCHYDTEVDFPYGEAGIQ